MFHRGVSGEARKDGPWQALNIRAHPEGINYDLQLPQGRRRKKKNQYACTPVMYLHHLHRVPGLRHRAGLGLLESMFCVNHLKLSKLCLGLCGSDHVSVPESQESVVLTQR
jgi:hypothetical protein